MVTTVFNNEEKVLVNAVCKGKKLSELSKEDAVLALVFSRQITNDDDAMMLELIDGTMEKVKGMTDAEWDELKMLTPFDVVADGVEDVSEVPADEEVL